MVMYFEYIRTKAVKIERNRIDLQNLISTEKH